MWRQHEKKITVTGFIGYAPYMFKKGLLQSCIQIEQKIFSVKFDMPNMFN